jgi:Zn finger protein HypA/HybF involved in hydrogenase expression
MSAGDRTLDGNAIGGQLLALFGVDLTAAPCVCDGCGAEEELARVDVYLDCPGAVVRCPHCGNVLLTIVRGRERTWVDLRGTRGLSL